VVISAREAAIWDALAEVSDPEIPAISLVDLGVIRSVQLDGGRLTVELLPTFVGCPAVEIMRHDVAERLRGMADEVDVRISFAEPWTSERISGRGRERLRASGFAPPVRRSPAPLHDDLTELSVLPVATCPYCGSRNTTLENPFGPTLCRAIYHCADCRQPFEQFKTV
jgi:ring-1,2-phenylacetyl-CoA epoxidase subunit PaaD